MKEYKYKVKGAEYTVAINEVEGKTAKVEVNGIPFEVEMDRPMNMVHTTVVRPVVHVHHGPVQAAPAPAAAPQPAAAPVGSGRPVRSPLPGTIVAIAVTNGQAVKRGDVVAVIEAMKMENNITADCDGTVTSVCVNKGDTVQTNAVLLTIG